MRQSYLVKGKTYLVEDLNMKREFEKKVYNFSKNLDEKRKKVFSTIANAIISALKIEQLNNHIESALMNGKPVFIKGNIYDLQEGFNRIAKKLYSWVRQNENFDKQKMQEFTVNILRGARSICKLFDTNAECWKKDAEAIAVSHV